MPETNKAKTYIYPCIKCPSSCEVSVIEKADGSLEIEGNTCKLGKKYVEKEHTAPERNVTTTVKIVGAAIPRLPVRSTMEVPKERMMDVMAASVGVLIKAPVKEGDVVLKGVADTEADLIACRSLEKTKS